MLVLPAQLTLTPVNTHKHTQTHTQTHTNTHKHTQTHTNTHKHTQTHTNTHKHTQTHTNTHKHTQTHKHPNTQTHNTQHRVQTHSFSWCEQFVLVILFHEIAANPIPGRELESSKHRRARARRSLARNWLRAAKAGWLTHSGKRRTPRALRLLCRHHRSEAPCMAPKQSTRPRTAAQPNDAEKKVQCGTCNSNSWILLTNGHLVALVVSAVLLFPSQLLERSLSVNEQ